MAQEYKHILVPVDGSKEAKLVQPIKALSPIEVTLEGISTDSSRCCSKT